MALSVGFRVQGIKFVWFRVPGLGFKVYGSGFSMGKRAKGQDIAGRVQANPYVRFVYFPSDVRIDSSERSLLLMRPTTHKFLNICFAARSLPKAPIYTH